MSFRTQSFGLNLRGRDIAIGDIHGCFVEVETALTQIQFDKTVDRLFCLGDLIDRGPRSHHVLEWLDKPGVHSIMGNHELMTWRSVNGLPFDRQYHKMNGGDWLERLPADEQAAIAKRLAVKCQEVLSRH